MEIKSQNPFLKLPEEPEVAIYLLKEELKSWKFFNVLRTIGLDDTFYQTDLSELILLSVGIADPNDDVMDFYQLLMERHSDEMDATEENITHHAVMAYRELVVLVDKR